jgi:predicted TIM-barrel fold metal-dependent hydrolase
MDVEHFPLFDAHAHFTQAYLDQGLASYERCGVRAGIVIHYAHYLDFGEFLRALRRRRAANWLPCYWPAWPEFGWRPREFVARLVRDLPRYHRLGCRGLKVWKDLGMFIVHPDGTPATMDDPRLEPVWRTVRELGWWISVHQGDPSARWKTCTGLTRDEIFRRRDRVIRAHRDIPFILCHNGNDIESVAGFGALLGRHPNAMSGIGRDFPAYDTLPDTQAFVEKYADRLLFGPDTCMPDGRPPDLKWEWEEMNLPWRRRIVGWGLSASAFRKFTWENGARFLEKMRARL